MLLSWDSHYEAMHKVLKEEQLRSQRFQDISDRLRYQFYKDLCNKQSYAEKLEQLMKAGQKQVDIQRKIDDLEEFSTTKDVNYFD